MSAAASVPLFAAAPRKLALEQETPFLSRQSRQGKTAVPPLAPSSRKPESVVPSHRRSARWFERPLLRLGWVRRLKIIPNRRKDLPSPLRESQVFCHEVLVLHSSPSVPHNTR